MATTKRKFTEEQKLEILRQAEQIGVTAALREHKLSYSVYARWREQAIQNDTYRRHIISRRRQNPELKQFMEENTRLKKIIADQALELERKDEELKKNNPLYGKG